MSNPKTVTSCMISGCHTPAGNIHLWQAVKGGWGTVISPMHEPAVLNGLRVLMANRDLDTYRQGDVSCERKDGGNAFLTICSNQPIEIQRADVEDVIVVLEKLRGQARVEEIKKAHPVASSVKHQPKIDYGVFSATVGHDRVWVSRVASENPTTWKAEIRFDELDELRRILALIDSVRGSAK